MRVWTRETHEATLPAAVATYEQGASLTHGRALILDDSDYVEPRDRRLSLIAVMLEVAAEIVTRTVTSFCTPTAVNPTEPLKSFSP